MRTHRLYSSAISVLTSIPAGSAAAPGLAFAGDPDTGFYNNAANEVAISLGGSIGFAFRSGTFACGTNPLTLRVNDNGVGGGSNVFRIDSGVASLVGINNSLGGINGFSTISNYGIGPAGGDADVLLTRDAAGVLANRNGTNAQKYRQYNTFTDESNYERASLDWTTNVFNVRPQAAGTGTIRGMNVGAANAPLCFYEGTPIAKQSGVAVSAAGIHAALVNLGLIAA